LPTSECLAIVVSWLFFLQPVAFSAKLVEFVQHLVQQRFGRGAGYSRMPQLPDFVAEALNLTATVLNISTNEINVRHVSTPDYGD
jgi:hypothetical protein